MYVILGRTAEIKSVIYLISSHNNNTEIMLQIFKHLEMVYAEMPFEEDECQVIFVDNGAHHELNEYVRGNLRELKSMFREQGLDFCYMPAMFEDSYELREQIRYRMPWLRHVDFEQIEKIRTLNAGEIMGAVNARTRAAGVAYSGPNEEVVMKIDVSQPGLYWNQFEEIAKAYGRKVQETMESKRRYDPSIYELLETLLEKKPMGVVREIIEKALGEDIVLSRVEISDSCDLRMLDYNGITVRLRPIEMMLFVFYLRHEEGVAFKDLSNYRDELKEIYAKYSLKDDPQYNDDKVDNLLDITKNAVNEHRSRMKLAFEREFDSAMARYYYITGKKGEKMKILLPRELVVGDY